MSPEQTRGMLEWSFTRWAREYERKLRPEDIMESTPQANQRAITLASMALVARGSPEVHTFNELPIQKKREGRKKPLQVCPDNMVVVHDGPLSVEGSYNIPLQPAGPFVVMEYVSRGSERKDYDNNVAIYEQELKVPYYLMYHPEIHELTLFRLEGEKYVTVLPNEAGRHPIPELGLEVGILDGWMRYWLRGELLPLPQQLMDRLEETQALLAQTQEQLKERDERLKERDERLKERDERISRTEADLDRERQLRADLERQLADLKARLEGK